MRIRRLTQPDERSTFQRRFEYILLSIVLCIIALRCTHTESLTSSGLSILIDYVSISQSLTFSILIILTAAIWATVNLIRGEFTFRISGFITGFTILTLAAGLATFFASDSRASINAYLTLASGIIIGIFMVQMLKRISTIRFVAIIIASLAVVNCYESFNQFTTSNDYMIEQYEENPEIQLNKIGIEPGTLQAFLYEHRLYSKDIKGYFTTGNSLGSFLILTGFTTVGLMAGKFRKFLRTKQNPIDIAIIGFILVVQIACFIASTSKGAGLACLIGVMMLLAWTYFNKLIAGKRNILFMTTFLGGGLLLVIITGYAAKTAYLPGGNSMLVRAEYWFAAARIIADNFLAGIGGGNFGYYYTLYKQPAAIETVLDPHNMILSIAAQYGIFGLIGFGLLIFIPLTKVIMPKIKIEHPENITIQDTSTDRKILRYSIAGLITLILFIIRPLLIPVEGTDDTGVMLYIMIVMYAAPAFILLLTIWLLDKAIDKDIDIEYMQAAMFCGIIAMLIHNLIDFAIFEPGVMCMLFLSTACFVSISKYRQNSFGWLIQIDRPDAIIISALGIAGLVVIIWLGYLPVICATTKLHKAFAHKKLNVEYITQAGNCDPFDCTMSPFIAKVLWNEYETVQNKNNLALAEKYFSMAIKKNPADFKNYMNLGKVRWEMAGNTQTYKRKTLLIEAEDAYRMALARYPGKSELHLELGKILFLQDRPEEANNEFAAALQIEKMFRKKFAKMYPDQEPVSRISPESYLFLKGVVEPGE
ncbi:MAG: O-antigen ligase family protein [Sedimentisphaeraceae bacterium JB056]